MLLLGKVSKSSQVPSSKLKYNWLSPKNGFRISVKFGIHIHFLQFFYLLYSPHVFPRLICNPQKLCSIPGCRITCMTFSNWNFIFTWSGAQLVLKKLVFNRGFQGVLTDSFLIYVTDSSSFFQPMPMASMPRA